LQAHCASSLPRERFANALKSLLEAIGVFSSVCLHSSL
jgi:hypothetical protein